MSITVDELIDHVHSKCPMIPLAVTRDLELAVLRITTAGFNITSVTIPTHNEIKDVVIINTNLCNNGFFIRIAAAKETGLQFSMYDPVEPSRIWSISTDEFWKWFLESQRLTVVSKKVFQNVDAAAVLAGMEMLDKSGVILGPTLTDSVRDTLTKLSRIGLRAASYKTFLYGGHNTCVLVINATLDDDNCPEIQLALAASQGTVVLVGLVELKHSGPTLLKLYRETVWRELLMRYAEVHKKSEIVECYATKSDTYISNIIFELE